MATNFGPGGKGENPVGDAAIAGEVSERMTGDPDRNTADELLTDDADETGLEQLPEHERRDTEKADTETAETDR